MDVRSEKSEKQKMLAGELYRGSDPELTAAQLRAQEQVALYNASAPAAAELRGFLLRGLFGRVGRNVTLRPPFHCDYGFNISVGDNAFFNFDCVFLDCHRITFGNDCQVGPGAQFYTATHPLDPDLRREGFESALPISIGNNVWIGGNAVICPGVSIGDNTVVGAGSVVTKSLPANVLAVGNPARVVRELSSELR